mmetsp:Transcript_34847/g.48334  ORF Transcript_34847/g.48334 Transcript_34847/m.48334 type:complete len:200 (+) Transcript_34847:12-611(+)
MWILKRFRRDSIDLKDLGLISSPLAPKSTNNEEHYVRKSGAYIQDSNKNLSHVEGNIDKCTRGSQSDFSLHESSWQCGISNRDFNVEEPSIQYAIKRSMSFGSDSRSMTEIDVGDDSCWKRMRRRNITSIDRDPFGTVDSRETSIDGTEVAGVSVLIRNPRPSLQVKQVGCVFAESSFFSTGRPEGKVQEPGDRMSLVV